MSDYENALKFFRYEEETGLLYHTITRAAAVAGAVAGCVDGDGYIAVGLKGKCHKAHRVVWLMKTGQWPSTSIDHIDRNKTNNRWSNLRLATPRQQQANLPISANNKSGVRGVFFSRGKWTATLGKRGPGKRYIGRFDTIEQAKAAFDDAARKHFGEFYTPENSMRAARDEVSRG